MLALTGSGALSPFRRKQLLGRLRTRDPGVREMGASFLHLVSMDRQPGEAELQRLRELLSYGPDWPQPGIDGSETLLLAVPRPGSISPWSTKATEIARLCGFPELHRIERAVRYRIAVDGPLGNDAKAELFDRMTQQLVPEDGSLDELFAPGTISSSGYGSIALARPLRTGAGQPANGPGIVRRRRSTTWKRDSGNWDAIQPTPS